MLNRYKVRELMIRKKLKGKDVARMLGVSEVAMSRYLTGARQPKEMTMMQLANALDVVPEEITICPVQTKKEDSRSVLNRVVYLTREYSQEWNKEDKMRILDSLM